MNVYPEVFDKSV